MSEELISEASQGENSDLGTIGFAAGFLIMMVLDITLVWERVVFSKGKYD